MKQECELKLALKAVEANRLQEGLGTPIRAALQLNYYLDGPKAQLRKIHYGLRLRAEYPLDGLSGPPLAFAKDPVKLPPGGRRFFLTLKGPSRADAEFVNRTEDEVALEHPAAAAILSGGLAPEAAGLALLPRLSMDLGVRIYRPFGILVNERRVYRLSPALAIELDRTHFPDGSVDHELEYELPESGDPSPEEAMVRLRELFAEQDLAWNVRQRGKFSRFLERRGS